MDGFLRQSTASQARVIGPFVDDTDFKTAETALTIANTDIKVSKAGGALASKNSGGGTADAVGYYTVTWDATDTATVGELKYTVKVAGALVVFGSYWVLEEEVYDDLFAASAVGYLKPTTAGRDLDVSAGGEAGVDWANVGSPTTVVGLSGTTVKTATDVETDTADIQSRLPAALTAGGNIKADALALNGSTSSAANLEKSASVIYRGTVGASPTTTTVADAGLTQADTDHWKGRIIIFTSGSLAFQASDITGFTPATDTLTFTALTNAPTASDTFVIV